MVGVQPKMEKGAVRVAVTVVSLTATTLETLMPVERAHAILKLKFPYVPGLLAYREADAMIAAIQKVSSDPRITVMLESRVVEVSI